MTSGAVQAKDLVAFYQARLSVCGTPWNAVRLARCTSMCHGTKFLRVLRFSIAAFTAMRVSQVVKSRISSGLTQVAKSLQECVLHGFFGVFGIA